MPAGWLGRLPATFASPSQPREVSMASDRRVHVTLECTQCKRRNYITEKNRHNTRDRVELKKYCRWCSGHTAHKETR